MSMSVSPSANTPTPEFADVPISESRGEKQNPGGFQGGRLQTTLKPVGLTLSRRGIAMEKSYKKTRNSVAADRPIRRGLKPWVT
jgi:hypothetical protein